MDIFNKNEAYNQNFIGREKELEWLDQYLINRNRSHEPIYISGYPGVGKTSLMKQWFASRRTQWNPFWINMQDYPLYMDAVEEVMKTVRDLPESSERDHYRTIAVVIDDCELNKKEYEEISARIFNYKRIASLTFISRQQTVIDSDRQLILEPISRNESEELLRKLLSSDFTNVDLLEAIVASKGYPLAIELISKLLQGQRAEAFPALIDKPLYELSNNILVPTKEIITSVTPVIFTASQNIVTALQKQPSDVHKLTPREFEILLSDLLKDMGWEVELTKQTRDGGADILAYLNTDVGRLLCLVEAKHYREDRKIGVDLVRTLYGTLCDAQANSAMLVTSSSFTKDAREFQQKHQYQLSLRDYADLVTWIIKYGSNKKNQNH